MEENMVKMSKNLAKFCNNLESSSSAFKQSLERRPIPLDSASTTFMQSLNRKVSAITDDLNLLESMSLGTVSFEELLGHCNQLYKLNHSSLVYLHSHLQSLHFIPSRVKISGESVDDLEEDFMAQSSCDTPEPELHSYASLSNNNIDDDSLFEESPSFQKLGLSDISLAILASGEVRKHDLLESPPKLEVHYQDAPNALNTVDGEGVDEPKFCETSKLIRVSNDDYENLPPYMKSVASWKDLQSAIEKMNSFLNKKRSMKESYFFHPEELESMGLGSKGRSYVLLLVRMKRINVETDNGLISYKVL